MMSYYRNKKQSTIQVLYKLNGLINQLNQTINTYENKAQQSLHDNRAKYIKSLKRNKKMVLRELSSLMKGEKSVQLIDSFYYAMKLKSTKQINQLKKLSN